MFILPSLSIGMLAVSNKKHKNAPFDLLSYLPFELIIRIFVEYLSRRELAGFRQVNHQWRRIIDSTPDFWTSISMGISSTRSSSMAKNAAQECLMHMIERASNYPVRLKISSETRSQRAAASNHFSMDAIWNCVAMQKRARIETLICAGFELSEPSLQSMLIKEASKMHGQYVLFHSMQWLSHLTLDSCQIPGILMAYMMTRCPRLESINIHACLLQSGVESLSVFASQMKRYQAEINGCILAQLSSISYKVGHCSNCQESRPSADHIWYENRLLSWILSRASMAKWKHIELEVCSVCFPKARLYEMIKRNASTLESFHLNRVSMETIPSFTESFGLLSKLTRLTLAAVKGIACDVLVTLVYDLQEIDLSYQSFLTDKDLMHIGQLNPTLCKINLTGCQRLTCSAISALLEKCPLLRHINISNGGFSTDKLLTLLARNPKPVLEEVIIRCPLELTSTILVQFLAIYGNQLTLLDLEGQSGFVMIDTLAYCREQRLISGSCVVKM